MLAPRSTRLLGNREQEGRLCSDMMTEGSTRNISMQGRKSFVQGFFTAKSTVHEYSYSYILANLC